MKLDFERDGQVATVTFQAANGVNVVSPEFRAGISDALRQIEESAECRVVIFRAEGKAFLAGADLQELVRLSDREKEELTWEAHGVMDRIAGLSQVTIAVIHAACVGGGLELALACDLRLGTPEARLGFPEVSLGLVPGWGGTVRTAALVGSHVARRMILSADLLPADEAHRIGLLDAVVPRDDVETALEQRVTRFLSRGPHALRAAKLLLTSIDRELQTQQLKREAQTFIDCLQSAEAVEGIQAFLEKRPPQWSSPESR